MMKKRILALLLAGLMTASLAACKVNGTNNPNGTEGDQTTPGNPTVTTPDPYTPPATVWTDVDYTLYVVTETKLRQEASNVGTALATVPAGAELHCTRTSAAWSYVEYGELSGYISNSAVTTTDLSGKNFTPVEGGEKIMYANAQTVNVRPYPTDADFSAAVGSFKLNDEVTVLATDGTWFKVKYIKNGEEKHYFVHGSCLDEAKVTDPDDPKPYEHLFTDVNGDEGVTKYVSVEKDGKVNFRIAPLTHKDTDIIMSLSNGCEVILLKTGTVNEMAWSYVAVLVESDKEGVPNEYKYGYISSDYLSDTNTTGDMSIEDLLNYYTTLVPIEGGKTTYYVLLEATITIRSTPVFPEENEPSNSLSNPQSGKTAETVKAINVYATGEIDGTQWWLVEYVKKDGENETLIRGFVGGKALGYLTSDASGKPTVTLEDLIIKYPQFSKLETPTKITTNSVANCYGVPETGDALGKLEAGTEVTLVAQEQGARATWYVIEDAEGKLYFVGKQFFN